MGKKLIECHCVDQYINGDEKKIYVDKTMILTPGVKDYLRNKGIAIAYGKAPHPDPEEKSYPEQVIVSEKGVTGDAAMDAKAVEKIMIRIFEILKGDHKIEDEEKIKVLSLQIFNRVNLTQNKE